MTRAVAVLAVVLAVGLAGTAIVAFRERARAQAAQTAVAEAADTVDALVESLRRSDGRRLVLESREAIAADPALALLLAAHGHAKAQDTESTTALATALAALQELQTHVHDDAVLDAAFVGDDVLTACLDGKIRRFTRGGAQRHVLTEESRPVTRLLVAPNAAHVVTFTGDPYTGVRLWTWPEGRLVAPLVGALDVRFAPLGTRLVAVSPGGIAHVYDVATGAELQELRPHGGPVTSACFSPNGSVVLTTSEDGKARLFDADGVLRRTVDGPPAGLASSAFAADGVRFAVGGRDGRVYVHSLLDETPGPVLQAGAPHVARIEFVDDDVRVVTLAAMRKGVRSHRALVHDVASGVAVLDLGENIASVATAPNGGFVAFDVSDAGAGVAFDRLGVVPYPALRGHALPPTSAAFDDAGARIVTGSADGTARVWRREPLGRGLTYRSHEAPIRCLDASRDGSAFVSGDENGMLSLRTSDGLLLQTIPGESGVTQVRFTDDGERVCSATDASLFVHEVATGILTAEAHGAHDDLISALRFAPPSTVVSAAFDETARVFDVDDLTLRTKLVGHVGPLLALATTTDGVRAATSANDRTIRLWRLADGNSLATLEGHRVPANRLAFRDDGKRLASAGDDPFVLLWNGVDGSRIAMLQGHGTPITALRWAGNRLLSGGTDGVVRVWDGDDGAAVSSFEALREPIADLVSVADAIVVLGHDGGIAVHAARDGAPRMRLRERRARPIAIAPIRSALGDAVVTAQLDGTLRIWPLDVAGLALRLAPRSLTADERARYSIRDD